MWKSFKLSDIVNIEIGKTPSRNNPKYWDKNKKSSNVWVSIRDMSKVKNLYIDDSNEYISDEGAKLFKDVPKNTLIMSFKLSIGKLAITKINLRTNEAIAAFKIKDKNLLSIKYLYYFLSSMNWDKLAGHDIKVKGKTLNKAKLKEIPISLPTLIEQKNIVNKIDNIFIEINLSFQLINKKEKNLEQLMNIYLLDKLNIDNMKNISNMNKMKLGDVCIVKRGTTITRKKTIKGNIPVIGGGTKPTYYHNKTNRDKNCITISGSGANAGYVNFWNVPIFASDCTTIETKNEKQLIKFVYYYLCSKQEYIYKNFRFGAAQPHVYAKDIAKLDFPILPLSQQQKIIRDIESIFDAGEIAKKKFDLNKNNYLSLKKKILTQEINSKVA